MHRASSRDTGGREPRNRCHRDGRTVARVRTTTGPPRSGAGEPRRRLATASRAGAPRSRPAVPRPRPLLQRSPDRPTVAADAGRRARRVRPTGHGRTAARGVRRIPAPPPPAPGPSAPRTSRPRRRRARPRPPRPRRSRCGRGPRPIAVAPRPVPSNRAKRRPGVPCSRSRSVPRRASATGARHSGSRTRWNDATPVGRPSSTASDCTSPSSPTDSRLAQRSLRASRLPGERRRRVGRRRVGDGVTRRRPG